MGLFIAYLLGILTGVKPKHNNGQSHSPHAHAHDGQSNPDKPVSVMCSPPPLSDRETADKKKGKRRKAIKFWVQNATLFVLSIYTGLTLLIWCATRKTAAAAMEANAISKDTAKKQLRAYVGVEPSFVTNLAPNSTTSVQVSITNFGQTPAYRFVIYTDVNVLQYPYPETADFPFLPPPNTDFESSAPIYPHAPIPGGKKMSRPLSKEEALSVYDGSKKRLYTGGVAFYDDIFGIRHCTRFFASLGGQELIEAVAAAKAHQPYSVPWRIAKRFNDDDMCETYH